MSAEIIEENGKKYVKFPVNELLEVPEFKKLLKRIEVIEKSVKAIVKYTHSHDKKK